MVTTSATFHVCEWCKHAGPDVIWNSVLGKWVCRTGKADECAERSVPQFDDPVSEEK